MNKKKNGIITRTLAVLLTGVLVLTGCQASEGLETDDLTISKYKDVEIEEVEGPEEVTDEDVEAYIDEQRAAAATYEDASDRAAEDGDTVNIDYIGYMDGEELENGSEEGCDLVIGSGDFIDGFEDSIIGHKVGDTFDWAGQFPDDYYEDLAGKDVTFTITLNDIQVEQVPELDDDFVKGVSETATTAEEYEEEIRKYLEERNETEHKLDIADAAWSVVMDNTTVKEYPEGAVEDMVDQINEQYEALAEIYGVDFETMVTEYMGYSTREDYDADAKEAAENSVKQSMAVDAIADKENLTLDDKTYEEMLEEIVVYYGYGDVESVEEAADEETLQDTAKEFMVKDWVGDHCIQVAGY